MTVLRTPSFWLLAVTVAIGTLFFGAAGGLFVFLTPWSAVAIVQPLAALAVALLMLIRYLDPLGRRPWWMVTLMFLWGATVSVAVGGLSGFYLGELVATATSPWTAATWEAALVAPPSEELVKLAGVVLLFLAARPYLTTVTAGAVYGAVVGVGFSVTEDATYALVAADETLPDSVADALRLVALRAFVPGLIGHPLFTALAGAGFAYAVLRTDRPRDRRVLMLVVGLGLSFLTHGAVNSPIAAGAAYALDQVPGVSALVGYFLVILVPSVVGLVWLARLRREDAALFTARLVAGGLATPDEAAVLPSRRARVRAVHAAAAANPNPAPVAAVPEPAVPAPAPTATANPNPAPVAAVPEPAVPAPAPTAAVSPEPASVTAAANPEPAPAPVVAAAPAGARDRRHERLAQAAGWRVVDALSGLAERPDPRARAALIRARADLNARTGSAFLPRPPAEAVEATPRRWLTVAGAVGAYMWLAGLLAVALGFG